MEDSRTRVNQRVSGQFAALHRAVIKKTASRLIYRAGTLNPRPANHTHQLTHGHLKASWCLKQKKEGGRTETGKSQRQTETNADREGKFSFASEKRGSCGFHIMSPCTLITAFTLLSNSCLHAAQPEYFYTVRTEVASDMKRDEYVLHMHVHAICRLLSLCKAKSPTDENRLRLFCQTLR